MYQPHHGVGESGARQAGSIGHGQPTLFISALFHNPDEIVPDKFDGGHCKGITDGFF